MTGSAVLQKANASRQERASATPAGSHPSYVARLHDSLDAVEPLWRQLQETGFSTVYQSLEWTRPLTRHILAAERARLVIVEVAERASDVPVLLLPMILRRRGAIRVIEWLDLGVCDYAFPLIAEGAVLSSEQAGAAWQAVRSVLPPADLVLIDKIVPHAFGLANPLAALAHAAPSGQQAFGIPLDGEPEALLKRICSPSFSRNLRKTRHRLEQSGAVELIAAEGAQQVGAFFDGLIEERLRRFRALGRADLLQQQRYVDFYRAAALASVSDGPVRLFGLSVGGEIIATVYGLRYRDAFNCILLAMGDDRWRRVSPGLYLAAEIVKWAGREGFSYLDLTVGSLSYKAAMGAQSQELLGLAEALTVRGRVFLAARQAVVSSKAWLRRHPEMFDRLRAVRQSERRLRAWLTGKPGDRRPPAAGNTTIKEDE